MIRRSWVSVMGLLFGIVPILTPSFTQGYETVARYRDTVAYYDIDPNFEASLSRYHPNDPATGAHNEARAAMSRWTDASAASFPEVPASDPYNPYASHNITTADFQKDRECQPIYYTDLPDTFWAYNCWLISSDNKHNDFAKIVLNASSSYLWNTYGKMESSTRTADVRTVVLHEHGHSLALQDKPDNHPEAIMWFNGNRGVGQGGWALTEDDKRGATLLFGPYTGFDNGRALGIQYDDANDHAMYTTYRAQVVNWFNEPATVPLMVHSEKELVDGRWIVPYYGDRMLRIEGASTGASSYVYFKLFTILDDTFNDHGMLITRGMHLKWCQYNFQQSTVSIDFLMSDGTALRHYPSVVDQHGVPLGPEYRGGYGTGFWMCFDVDLSPLAGKEVKHWYVAYDNRRTGSIGKFRAYVDSLRIVVPGGKS